MKRVWKQLSSKIVYENPWLRLQEDRVISPGGENYHYSFLAGNDAVIVIALNQKSLFLLQEYRYPTKRSLWGLPAGIISAGETPLEAAQRELFEETGITAKAWKKQGTFFVNPGSNQCKFHVFSATGLNLSKKEIGHQEGNESILAIKPFPIEIVKKMIRQNKIECGQSLAALHLHFSKAGK